MAKKTKFDGVIVKREIDSKGYVHACDKNGRPCWGDAETERVILTQDLREYAAGLHIGQLGWTVPGTTDGYKWVDVKFDNGVQLPILVYGLDRVSPEKADRISARLILKNKNTRFDSDPVVAEKCRHGWVRKAYEAFVNTDEMTEAGNGNQEVYAYTFPSLKELAEIKHEARYPVKVGYTTDKDEGALGRIRSQITSAAAFPERPIILLVHKTWNGRSLEVAVHKRLREQGRRLITSPGVEWFMTNHAELSVLCSELQDSAPKPQQKPCSGASHTLQELLGDSSHIEIVKHPGSASVGLRIVPNVDSNGGCEGHRRD